MKLKLKDIFNTLALGLFFGAGLTAINGTTIFHNDDVLGLMPHWEFFLMFGLAFIGALFVFIYNLVRKEYKPSIILSTIFIILFISGLIIISTYQGKDYSVPQLVKISDTKSALVGPEISFLYSVEPLYKIRFILQYLLLLLSTFFIFDTMPKIYKGTNIISFACLGLLGFATFCCIYSYVKEWNTYVAIFKDAKDGILFKYSVTSMYNNKNYYGILIFAAVLASFFLHSQRGHVWWIPIGIFFYINLICTMDKTAMILGTLFVPVYLVYRTIITWKDHPKRNIIATLVSVGTIVSILFSLHAIMAFDRDFREAFNNSFSSQSFGSFESRKVIWKMDEIIMLNSNALFGAGFKIFADLIRLFDINATGSTDPVYAAHNGYHEMIGMGGILLLIVFLLMSGQLIYLSIKYFKKETSMALFTLLGMLVMSIYMVVESGTYLFSQTLDYTVISMMICFPLLEHHFQAKKLEMVE